MERRSRKEIFKPINLADFKVCSFGRKRLKSGTNFVSLLWGGLITVLFLVGGHCPPGPPQLRACNGRNGRATSINADEKLTTLLALLTAQRCQTLSSLDLDFMQEIDNEIIFTIREKLKTSKAGKHLPPIKFLSYPEDIRLCPVAHIKFYIGKTKPMRSHSKLLLSYVKPFKPVTNSTIGR
jgi:hypothetical protein